MVSGVVAQKLQALDRALAELRSVGRLTANDLALSLIHISEPTRPY